MLIELSSHLHLLSFSLSLNSIGDYSCLDAGNFDSRQTGKHRPYSYIRVYFLTSTNCQSCLFYLTGAYNDGSATIGEGSWYVVLMVMCLSKYDVVYMSYT